MKVMKKSFLLIALFYLPLLLWGQIPDGYYDSAEGLSGEALKAALHNIIDDHTELTYDQVWDVLVDSDEDPSNSNNFILLYTGRSLDKSQTYPDWNREHVWAKSHGDFDTNPPEGTDAHHLRPTDVSVNSDRGSKDFDNGGTQHSEATGCYYDEDSWEPRDAVKGDVARMMFYMTVRYEGDNGEEDLELVDYTGTSGPIFGKLSTLLEWHQNDPVDDVERHRNEIVYDWQNNRNPFIDHPEYVAAIWEDEMPNQSPEISNVEHTPTAPVVDNVVTVHATITDSDGSVAAAVVNWGTTSGSLSHTVNMSASGNTWSGEIPGQTDPVTIYYKVEAEDDDGATDASSEYSYDVQAGANELPVIESVEYSPDNPAAYVDIAVNAVVTDSDGSVEQAILEWGFASGSYGTQTEMSATENTWSATIDGQESGTDIFFIVSAIDDTGAEVKSTEYAISIAQENERPQISAVTIDPSSPDENDTVYVRATITDDGTVADAQINWKLGSETEIQEVEMNGSGTTWEGFIPPQEAGKKVYFMIVATDDLGAEANYTDGSYEVAASTGVNVSENTFLVYPNPANTRITVSFGQVLTGELSIYNALGNTVLKKNIRTKKEVISLQHYPEGIYFLEVISGNQKKHLKKILIAR